ncbi:MAG: hypothetical protein HOY78_12130 [Saccharothrix sp.]|nr:hypothetical protein [Saccharothrix sp.]
MLQFVIPVKLRTFGRLALAVLATLAGLAVMWLAFGLLGALVLLALVVTLGRLLLRTARGD